jgi:hypothetical protein
MTLITTYADLRDAFENDGYVLAARTMLEGEKDRNPHCLAELYNMEVWVVTNATISFIPATWARAIETAKASPQGAIFPMDYRQAMDEVGAHYREQDGELHSCDHDKSAGARASPACPPGAGSAPYASEARVPTQAPGVLGGTRPQGAHRAGELVEWARYSTTTLSQTLVMMERMREMDPRDGCYDRYMVKLPQHLHDAAITTLLKARPELDGMNWHTRQGSLYLSGGAALGAVLGEIDPESDLDLSLIRHNGNGVVRKEDVRRAYRAIYKHMTHRTGVGKRKNSWVTPHAHTLAATYYESGVARSPSTGRETSISVLRKANYRTSGFGGLGIVQNYDVPCCGVVMTPSETWLTYGALWCIANQAIYYDTTSLCDTSPVRYDRHIARTGWAYYKQGSDAAAWEEIEWTPALAKTRALKRAVRSGSDAKLWDYHDRDAVCDEILKQMASGHCDKDGNLDTYPQIMWNHMGTMWSPVAKFHWTGALRSRMYQVMRDLPISSEMREPALNAYTTMVFDWPIISPEWKHGDALPTPGEPEAANDSDSNDSDSNDSDSNESSSEDAPSSYVVVPSKRNPRKKTLVHSCTVAARRPQSLRGHAGKARAPGTQPPCKACVEAQLSLKEARHAMEATRADREREDAEYHAGREVEECTEYDAWVARKEREATIEVPQPPQPKYPGGSTAYAVGADGVAIVATAADAVTVEIPDKVEDFPAALAYLQAEMAKQQDTIARMQAALAKCT